MATTKTKSEVIEDIKTENIKVEEKPKTKKFANDDLIDCVSITNGELLMIGNKTKNLYTWADYNDVTAVEYQDLLYEVRSARNSFATYPRFIILDDDFIAQNKQLSSVYDNIYSSDDLYDLLNQSANVIKNTLPTLPKGVQESIKGIASTMIENGSLDSVSKIKVLDEYFGTQMLQILSDH